MVKAARITEVHIPANAPYRNPQVAQEQAWAIKALFEGKASESDQGIAVRFILGTLSQLESFPYYPDESDLRFALGRRYVGHQIARIVRFTPEDIAKLGRLIGSPTAGEDDEMPNT